MRIKEFYANAQYLNVAKLCLCTELIYVNNPVSNCDITKNP